MKYVLVGAGGAGSAAAQAIRRYDKAGSILLVGQEHSRPYLRPALSKQYLRREKSRTELATEPIGWYADAQIELRSGCRAAHLDTARRAVTLDSGEEVSFDKLLLATGASPKPLRIPGTDLPNVFYLRTIDDCDRLHHAIDKAKTEGHPWPASENTSNSTGAARLGRVAVIGSGLLAVEVAASLRQAGLHVEMIVRQAHPWAKFAGDYTGQVISRYLREHGIAMHNNLTAKRLEGDGRVQRVIGQDGRTIECDFVLAAIGIVSNRELLRGTPIAAENAILVDEHCRTNVEDVYAAGDCAAVFDPLFGKHRILDHWDSASVAGAIAGANMAGAGDVYYNQVNTYDSEVFGLTLRAWGEGRLVDRRLVRAAPTSESPEFAEIGVGADGRVAQVLALGMSAEHELFKELVKRRLVVDGNEEAIKDSSQPLRDLL